jgi:hypothetical protein
MVIKGLSTFYEPLMKLSTLDKTLIRRILFMANNFIFGDL